MKFFGIHPNLIEDPEPKPVKDFRFSFQAIFKGKNIWNNIFEFSKESFAVLKYYPASFIVKGQWKLVGFF